MSQKCCKCCGQVANAAAMSRFARCDMAKNAAAMSPDMAKTIHRDGGSSRMGISEISGARNSFHSVVNRLCAVCPAEVSNATIGGGRA
jgi:hypothetical protein